MVNAGGWGKERRQEVDMGKRSWGMGCHLWDVIVQETGKGWGDLERGGGRERSNFGGGGLKGFLLVETGS